MRKGAAVIAIAAMLSLGYGPVVSADHVDIHISPAAEGAVILDGNATTTVLASFANDLDLASSTSTTLEASGTTTATAYYGVDVESATTTGDVHWEITVSHATASLSGGITITEKGYFDADGGAVEDSAYTSAVVSGDLVFSGNSGWEVSSGETFTNVDEIVFDADSPLGVYTITRTLVDTSTDAAIAESFSFTINLVAAVEEDTTPPSAPVITSPIGPVSTTTNPITVSGMAEASSTVSVSGGSGTASTTASGGGSWSLSVSLTPNATGTLAFIATDASGNASATTTLNFTHTTSTSTGATSTPIITLTGDEVMNFFICNVDEGEAFVDPGFSATDSSGATITATSTGTVNLHVAGTYTITYTATDEDDRTATTTRTVIVRNCSSGGGGGGGGGNAGGAVRGLARAAAVTPPADSIAGNAFGLATFQATLLPPGQVLGASAVFQFVNNLRVGMSGPEVMELQRRLTETGYYNGPITGYFGPLTRAALVKFQRAHGLPPTGFFGPMTRALMNS